MLYWALIFFTIAVAAALFGFAAPTGGEARMAQMIFAIFAVLFIFSLVSGGFRHHPRH